MIVLASGFGLIVTIVVLVIIVAIALKLLDRL